MSLVRLTEIRSELDELLEANEVLRDVELHEAAGIISKRIEQLREERALIHSGRIVSNPKI